MDKDCEDTNHAGHCVISLWNNSWSLRRPRSCAAEETFVVLDICRPHQEVGRVISPLRCNAPVTRVAATEDDYTERIDNVQEYGRVHDSCLDGRQRRLWLSPHFHCYENVHTLAMSRENHLQATNDCRRSSRRPDTYRAVEYHYSVEVLRKRRQLVRV